MGQVIIDQEKESEDYEYCNDFLDLHISVFAIRYWLFALDLERLSL